MIPVADLIQCLPHSPPMLLLSEILDINEQSLRALSLIKSDNPFLENGLFPCAAAIEVFAQASGVLFAQVTAQTALNTKPKKQDATGQNHLRQSGAVIQLKTFELGNVDISAGSELLISVDYIGGSDQAILAGGDICLGHHTVFKGSLMIAFNREPHKDKYNDNS